MSISIKHQTIIVATLPRGAEAPAYARRLFDRHAKGALGHNLAFEYEYGTALDLSMLHGLGDLPWRDGEEACVIRSGKIGAARAACKEAVADLDALAAAICENTDSESEDADIRHFLEDETGLRQALDGETTARRLAQVFAAVVRTVRRAAKHERGVIVAEHTEYSE